MKNFDVVKKLLKDYDVEDVNQLCVILAYLLERAKIEVKTYRCSSISENYHLYERINYLEDLLAKYNIYYKD